MALYYSLVTLFMVFIIGSIYRLMILSRKPSIQKRHWVHFGLGTCYEFALSCLYALLVYGIAGISLLGSAIAAFAINFFVIGFYFTDYRYFIIFQTHLPFSVKEYMEDAKAFQSSFWGVIIGWHFPLMVVLPNVLVWYLLFEWLPKANLPEFIWIYHAVSAGIIFLIGLAANTVSNSYVTKNIHDPLQFTPIQYFVKTKKLNLPKPAELDQGTIERLQIKGIEYPFLKEKSYSTAIVPSGFEELVSGVEALDQPPNFVILHLESFRGDDIGVHGSDLGISPCYDELSKKGILFQNFHANSFQTRHALIASFCSTIPNYGPSIMRFYPDTNLTGVPELLKDKGYSTIWIHNANADFDHMRRFLLRNGVDKIIDEYDFPTMTQRLGWGISDEALMIKAVEDLKEVKEPFWGSLLTISNHHPFEVPKSFQSQKNQNEYERYLDAFKYTDFCLGKFFDLVKEQPYYKNTIFFITADSSNFQQSRFPLNTIQDRINHNHRIPLLIHADWLTKGIEVNTPGSQVDIPPTIMDLIGFEGKLPWVGQSYLSEKSNPYAIVHKPARYMGLLYNEGAAIYEQGKWQWEGKEPEIDRLKWVEDMLFLNRWAIENNKFK